MRGLQYARTRIALSCWWVLANAINSDLLESEPIVCGAVSLAPSESMAVDCEVSVTADRDNFHIKGEYRASASGEIVKRRSVDTSIPRKYV